MTDGHGVDVILDFIGASYWEKICHRLLWMAAGS